MALDRRPAASLVPANVTNPVPACLQQSVAIPPELREIVGQLREAPVNWLPSVHRRWTTWSVPFCCSNSPLPRRARASQMLQMPQLPSSASGESGAFASTIANVYSCQPADLPGLHRAARRHSARRAHQPELEQPVASRAIGDRRQRPGLLDSVHTESFQRRCPAHPADLQRGHVSSTRASASPPHRPARLGRTS